MCRQQCIHIVSSVFKCCYIDYLLLTSLSWSYQQSLKTLVWSPEGYRSGGDNRNDKYQIASNQLYTRGVKGIYYRRLKIAM